MKQIFTAKSIDEAKAMAVTAFGIDESRIKFSVLEEPKKGLFGIIKGDAKVEAEFEKSKAEIASDYIKNVLDKMGVENTLSVTENEEGAVIEINGDTTGAIIGRRGETLDAIQYLASMVANKGDKEYYRITVDSCGYREKRKAILEDLAAKISKTVLRTGRTSTLEPMNPYERRIIHSKVSEIEGVTSKSIGEGPYRRVVISSTNPRPQRTDGAPRTYNGNRRDGDKNSYNNNRRGNNKEGGYGRRNGKRDEEFTPRSLDMMKTSFEKEYKKPKPEDELVKGSLYGKIDI